MANNIIIDTGPIIGLIDRRDQHHGWCKRKSADLEYPFFTCEAVLSEAFHLLEPISNGRKTLLSLLEKQLIKVNFRYAPNAKSVHQAINKYANLPASFADACLLQIAEEADNARIFTLDTDFTIYRDSNGNPYPLIYPE